MHSHSAQATRILAAALFLAMLSVLFTAIPRVFAQGQPPQAFQGAATLDEAPAQAGKVATALAKGGTAGAATVVNPGGGIETLRIRNAGLAGCIPDALKYTQSANTGVPGNNLALPFCADYALPSTVGSIANATPGAAPLPGQPTPTPEPTTPIGAPTVSFHASQTEVMTGEPVRLTLSVANSTVNPEITLRLVLQLPPGLLLSGEGIDESCSVQCSVTYQVPTGEGRDFLLTAVANRAGAFDIDSRIEWYFGNDAGTTQGGEVETLRLVASAPEATPTPMPTPAPTQPPTPEPTPSPHAGRATVNIHALQTKVQLGEPVVLTLTADNSAGGPQMTVKLGLIVPSGWSVSGAGFSEACSGTCIATYMVPAGDIRSIMLDLLASKPGTFRVRAEMEWWFGNDTTSLDRSVETLELTAGELFTEEVAPSPTPVSSVPSGGGAGFGDFAMLGLVALVVLPLVVLMVLAARSRRVIISSVSSGMSAMALRYAGANNTKVIFLSPLLLMALLYSALYLLGPIHDPYGLGLERSLNFFKVVAALLPPAVVLGGIYILAHRHWVWAVASGILIALWMMIELSEYLIDRDNISSGEHVLSAFVIAIFLTPAAIVHFRQTRD